MEHDFSPLSAGSNAIVIKSCKEPLPGSRVLLTRDVSCHSYVKVPVFLSVLYLILRSVSYRRYQTQYQDKHTALLDFIGLMYFIVVHQKNHHAIVELASDSDKHIKACEFCFNFPFAIEGIKGLSEIHDEDTQAPLLFAFWKDTW